MFGAVKWYGWSVVQDLHDLICEKIYSSWMVGRWAPFEDTPLHLQFMGGQCVDQQSGLVGHLYAIYKTAFCKFLFQLVCGLMGYF